MMSPVLLILVHADSVGLEPFAILRMPAKVVRVQMVVPVLTARTRPAGLALVLLTGAMRAEIQWVAHYGMTVQATRVTEQRPSATNTPIQPNTLAWPMPALRHHAGTAASAAKAWTS